MQILRVAVRDQLELTPWRPPANLPPAGMVYGEVTTITDKGRPAELAADPLISRLVRSFQNQVRLPLGPKRARTALMRPWYFRAVCVCGGGVHQAQPAHVYESML